MPRSELSAGFRGSYHPWLNPYWRFNIGGPVHPTQSVQGVDKTLGLAAVYASVRIISDMVASLPINVYRRLPDGTAQRMPSSQLLDNPSLSGTTYDWVFTSLTSALLWGNAWGLITSRTGVTGPDGLGYPANIEWLPPDRMNVQDDEMQPWNPLRTKIYFDGHEMQREELVHIRAFSIPGRTEGISPMRAFATLISQGLGALDYSHDWYHNGGFPPGTFQNIAEEVNATQAKEIRQRLTETLRMHQPLVYGRDWEYKAISIPPQEAAFVESMQLNATQIAAVYGLPPERVGGKRGDSLTYSTEQQETLALITDTLRPWLTRYERAFNALLPSTQYAKFDVDELLKTDLKTKYEIMQLQTNMGVRSTDELRRSDDLQPLPNGAGASALPLVVLERMAATTRAIPKAWMNQLILEQELAAELLLKLQGEGVAAPTDPAKPPVISPSEYIGHQLTLSRAWQGWHIASRNNGGDLEHMRDRAWDVVVAAEHERILDPEDRNIRLKAIGRARSVAELESVISSIPGSDGPTERHAAPIPSRPQQVQHSETPFGPAHQKATDSDRKRAGSWITGAHAAGALDDDERNDRLGKASVARIKGALGELVKDLPSESELAGELKKLASTPDHSRAGDGPQSLYGSSAVMKLRELQGRWESELVGAPASMNGKGTH